jgi:hypothetical protein
MLGVPRGEHPTLVVSRHRGVIGSGHTPPSSQVTLIPDGEQSNKGGVPCQGPVPRVPQSTGYDPTKSGYGTIPSSGNWMGNQVLHTRYSPTSPG